MRFEVVYAILAASAVCAAPTPEADYAPKPYEAPKPTATQTYEAPKPTYEAPKPTYEAPKEPLFDGISEAALQLIKFKLALWEAGFKIILSPFEQSYVDKYHPAPAYPAPEYAPKHYSRDYKPEPAYEAPKPSYEAPKENPFEVISDAALAVLRFKLYLLETGAKIILSPFEQSYVDKYHPTPAYPAPKTHYARDYKPSYEAPKENLGEELSEAALEILKFKLYLISQGAKIILSPLEAAYNEKHHPAPEYPAPKSYYN